ncbi:Mut7-C RNAse domain-containing protein [Caballeronia sp.]|uniref:Mut7-C RNAse domain-containing protein n=1 Tax=Caballeronia sp. TaxID=1931223 RepID=UPI003C589163
MVVATFRFYEELNDFLPPALRQRDFERACAHAATLKHTLEALGVPHTEVELILINGESAGFERILREGDRVAVYPTFEAFDITPLLQLRDHPLRVTRFIADRHLGGLARLLRVTGFDTLWNTASEHGAIAEAAARDHRIVLTRDCELLKRRDITHGCFVRARQSALQLREIFERLDLARSARPFTLCMHCNAPLRKVDKSGVQQRVPAPVFDCYERFTNCDLCGRIFWEGLHWQRMLAVLDGILVPS